MSTKKVISLILLMVFVFSIFSTVMVLADEGDKKTKSGPLDWITKSADKQANETAKSFEKLGANIYVIINAVGYIIGFILLIIWGIRHWLSSGDSTAKRDLKEQGSTWLKGAIIVFGASFIYTLIYNFVSGF